MRHRKFTFKIGKTSSHRKALLANAACSLFTHGRISTTIVRAKQIRRLAEKVITWGKKGTLHTRRLAISKLRQPNVVAQVFAEIAPLYADRPGGYTRIMRMDERLGDGAQLCVLELVEADAPMEAVEAEAVEAEVVEAEVVEAEAVEAEVVEAEAEVVEAEVEKKTE